MAKKPVKLDDVAREAGVSKTTVSRVLNQRGYLSEETIAKVQRAMEKLNYRPNAIARQLYKQETKLVGLIFPTIDDPFFGQLEAALENELYRRGYKVLMGNSQNNPAKERSFLRQLLNRQVDGLIVGAHNQAIGEYQRTNLPIVSIEQIVSRNVPVVASDNYNGGRLATQRLLDDGCQHIIHTNYPEDIPTPNHERRLAYENLLRQHGQTPITYHISFDDPVENKRAIIRQIFEDHPEVDGIFADNDTNAGLIMNIAGEFKRLIPEDLRVVGYDGANATRILLPQLTTIQQPINQMAETAVAMLQARINGEQVASKMLPVKIIDGGTA